MTSKQILQEFVDQISDAADADESFNLSNLADFAKVSDTLRIVLLSDFDETGIDALAEQEFLQAINYLNLATTSFKKAEIHHSKALTAHRLGVL